MNMKVKEKLRKYYLGFKIVVRNVICAIIYIICSSSLLDLLNNVSPIGTVVKILGSFTIVVSLYTISILLLKYNLKSDEFHLLIINKVSELMYSFLILFIIICMTFLIKNKFNFLGLKSIDMVLYISTLVNVFYNCIDTIKKRAKDRKYKLSSKEKYNYFYALIVVLISFMMLPSYIGVVDNVAFVNIDIYRKILAFFWFIDIIIKILPTIIDEVEETNNEDKNNDIEYYI